VAQEQKNMEESNLHEKDLFRGGPYINKKEGRKEGRREGKKKKKLTFFK
jgi:hypothetical protein